MRRILAIAMLTLKAAFRYRVFVILSILLLGSVIALPVIIKDDGTARGFTQIILTYTLSITTALLGFTTLWLSCGVLAREIEEAQMQLVVVKPIARWQIWLGKWLGLLALNAMLLALAGGSIYALMLWRSSRLSEKEQAVLQKDIFVARKVARENLPDYENMALEIVRERLKNSPPPEGLSIRAVQTMIREQLKARDQVLPPGYRKQWEIHIGDPADLRNRPMVVRTKVDPPVPGVSQNYPTNWEFGDPNTKAQWRTNFVLPAEALIEFQIPANLVNDKGILYVFVDNFGDKPMVFPLENGMEILYPVGGFGLNYVRGLLIVFSWLALIAAVGLTAATFLSFPVAAFCTIGILLVSFSSGTLKQIIAEGGVIAVNPNTGYADAPNLINQIAVPFAQFLLALFNLARGFSPIDNLSSGVAVTWGELAQALFQICIVLCGLLAAIGMTIFTRRELATAQK